MVIVKGLCSLLSHNIGLSGESSFESIIRATFYVIFHTGEPLSRWLNKCVLGITFMYSSFNAS